MCAAHTKSWGTLLCPSFVSAIRLRARADRRVRHRDGPFGLLLLGETDALAGVGSGARDVVHLRQPTRCRCLAWLRRIRHEIRSALTGEGVLGFTAGARRYRRRRICRYGDDGDRRRGCDSDRKSAGKYQSSCWKLQGRHHHAFCSVLLIVHRGKRCGALPTLCMRSTSSLPMARPKLWRQRPSARGTLR